MFPSIQYTSVPLAISRAPLSRAPVSQRMPWRPANVMSGPAKRPEMGQATGIAAFGAFGLLLAAAIGAGTAWVGFSTGQREKGLLQVLGYGIGSLGALGALGGTIGALLWIAGVSMVSGEIERSKERQQEFLRQVQQTTPSVPSIPPSPPLSPAPSFSDFSTEFPA